MHTMGDEAQALRPTHNAASDPAAYHTKPFRFKGGTFGVSCICSSVPNEVDQTGQELSGLYPPFSDDPIQVEVRIPGFPPITGVPVTRG